MLTDLRNIAAMRLVLLTVTCSFGFLIRPVGAVNVRAVAFSGEPFGVAQITVDFNRPTDALFYDVQGYALAESDRRIHYPVFVPNYGIVGIRDLLDMGPRGLTCTFLFRGEGPLELGLSTPAPLTFEVVPRRDPEGRDRMLRNWWLQYSSTNRDRQRDGDYPAVMEAYLLGMLGNRLRIESPRRRVRWPDGAEPTRQVLELLAGTETLLLDRLRQSWTTELTDLNRTEPVPDPPSWAAPRLSQVVEGDDNDLIEPIADYVPQECYYIRFGRFSHYVWLKQFGAQQGGDIARLVTLRGYDQALGQRTENQLGLKETALSRTLGETVIEDMAIIGRDFFVSEGPAIGLVFHAKNRLVLQNQLSGQRRSAWRQLPERRRVSDTIRWQGAEIDYLGSDDQRLRSFMVQRDDMFLVTNTLAIAKRFVTAAAGVGNLASDAEFRAARGRQPLHGDQVAFVFLSRSFQSQLLAPQTIVEMNRRVEATAHLQMVQMATWAGAAEQLELDSLSEAADRGLLPDYFADPEFAGRFQQLDSEWMDSQRGRRGSFLPIADTKVERLTRREADIYRRLQSFQSDYDRQLDPIEVSVAREKLAQADRYRLHITARVAPLAQSTFDRLDRFLGPPTKTSVSPTDDKIVSLQAFLRGGNIAPQVDPHLLFLEIYDLDPRGIVPDAPLLKWLQLIRTTPAYVGGWPKPGLLELLPIGFRRSANQLGPVQFPFGLWRWQTADGFALLSFHIDILESVIPQLQIVEAENPAQLRLWIGDLAASRFGSWVDTLSYRRAQQVTVGNSRLLNTMSQQFGLPRAKSADAAERLLDLKLVCPLRGELEFRKVETDTPDAFGYWISTRLVDGRATRQPQEFRSPLMYWFRGVRATAVFAPEQVHVDAQLDIETDVGAPSFQLPGIPAFPGFGPADRAADEDAPSKPEVDRKPDGPNAAARDSAPETLPLPEPKSS